MQEIRAVVAGKVQGVAYRYFTQDAASDLELTGWVRNRRDGTVEVCAQGTADVLKEFVEHLHEGSLMAKVESVSVDWHTVKTVYDDFSIKH